MTSVKKMHQDYATCNGHFDYCWPLLNCHLSMLVVNQIWHVVKLTNQKTHPSLGKKDHQSKWWCSNQLSNMINWSSWQLSQVGWFLLEFLVKWTMISCSLMHHFKNESILAIMCSSIKMWYIISFTNLTISPLALFFPLSIENFIKSRRERKSKRYKDYFYQKISSPSVHSGYNGPT